MSQAYLNRQHLNHNSIQVGMEVEQNDPNQLPKIHTFGEPAMREFNPYGENSNQKLGQFSGQKHLIHSKQSNLPQIDPMGQPQEEGEEENLKQQRSQKFKERGYMIIVFLIILGLGLYVGGVFQKSVQPIAKKRDSTNYLYYMSMSDEDYDSLVESLFPCGKNCTLCPMTKVCDATGPAKCVEDAYLWQFKNKTKTCLSCQNSVYPTHISCVNKTPSFC